MARRSARDVSESNSIPWRNLSLPSLVIEVGGGGRGNPALLHPMLVTKLVQVIRVGLLRSADHPVNVIDLLYPNGDTALFKPSTFFNSGYTSYYAPHEPTHRKSRRKTIALYRNLSISFRTSSYQI